MSGARQGRRRRILQEEVLSASRESTAYSPEAEVAATGDEGRRYAMAAGSLGCALARRHFPSRAIAPAGVLVGGVVITAGLAALHHYRFSISGTFGEQMLAFCEATSPTSLAAWLAASTMLAAALLGTMIMAVRRRRVDDYRGSHQLWRGAVVMALVLSVDAVTNLHAVAADAMASVTGVRLMAGGAEWWLAVGALVFGWVGVRVLLDVKESKLALVALLAAVVAGGVAVFGPMMVASAVVARLAQVMCYLLIAASLVAYMRFLHHDVAAGIATKPQKSRPAELKLAKGTVDAKSTSGQDDRSSSSRKSKRTNPSDEGVAAGSAWTDGSDGYSETYDDDDGESRKLSKSERKRLRQQRAERRAA